jgi:mRNA interferase MazF
MTKVTVAPITSTVKGLSSEVPVGPANGLEQDSAISLDNVVTIQASLLGRPIGFLTTAQEELLARAIVLAYDLDIALLHT